MPDEGNMVTGHKMSVDSWGKEKVGDLPEPNSRTHLVTSLRHVKGHKISKHRSKRGETRVGGGR